MPEFFDVLRTRRTVRSYTSEPIVDHDLQELIDCAVLAPTGMNLQPWAFKVVTSQEVLRQLNAIVLEMLRSPAVQAHITSPRMKEMLNDPGYDIFYGAPALIMILGDTKVIGAMYDCQLAAENLLLTVQAKGLGACYMGFLTLAADRPDVRELLAIDGQYKIMAAMIVGHPDVRPSGPPQRKPARIDWIR